MPSQKSKKASSGKDPRAVASIAFGRIIYLQSIVGTDQQTGRPNCEITVSTGLGVLLAPGDNGPYPFTLCLSVKSDNGNEIPLKVIDWSASSESAPNTNIGTIQGSCVTVEVTTSFVYDQFLVVQHEDAQSGNYIVNAVLLSYTPDRVASMMDQQSVVYTIK